MPLTVSDNALVVHGDKLGTEQACCCSGSCCLWSCEYVADIIFPDIEDPEDIPDISAGMIAAGWFFRDGVGYVKVITGEVDCDDPENVAEKNAELEAEVDAIVAGAGGVSDVNLIPEVSGFGCLDRLTQEECEETYSGTFRAGVRCDEDECEENPLP